ncbi:MAG TPA: hypothetical protein VL989_00100 [Candidatus Sulfotelmatobacter sp.]|nr:hypothetical protein [Candidatus Sulfotelmatobacter sp.]
MDFFFSLFFGAGVAAIAYNTLGRRVGYTNNQSILIFLAVVFVVATLFFFTMLDLILNVK